MAQWNVRLKYLFALEGPFLQIRIWLSVADILATLSGVWGLRPLAAADEFY